MVDRSDRTYGEEDIDANEYDFCGLERNLVTVESV